MELEGAIDSVRPCVVQIRLVVGQPRERPVTDQAIGTGFIVSRQAHVITAKHVIDGARAAAQQNPGHQVYLKVGLALPNSENMRGNFSLVGADLISEDAPHDLALLRMGANPFLGEMTSGIVINDEPWPLLHGQADLDPERPRDGESIAVSGYPLNEPVMMTNAGFIASSWSSDLHEVQLEGAPPDFTVPQMSDVYIGDVQANPGNSGGPVYRVEDGRIIGVCVAGKGSPVWTSDGRPVVVLGQQLLYAARLTIMIPAKYVVALIDDQGIDWSTRADDLSDDQDNELTTTTTDDGGQEQASDQEQQTTTDNDGRPAQDS